MSFQYSDYYDDDSDLDNASVSSSGDEGGMPDDIILSHGKKGEKRRFRLNKPRSRSSSHDSSRSRSRSRLNSSSSASGAVAVDVLAGNVENSSTLSGMEEEMEKELDKAVEATRAEYDRQLANANSNPEPSTCMEVAQKSIVATKKQNPSSVKKKYDDVYFDSDDEDLSDEATKKRDVKSNDELFYDPDMDETDNKWMENIRSQYHQHPALKQPPASSTQPAQARPVRNPNSDAVLNCPACMSLLCADCQRHDTYSHQYRAMFVFNCKVDHSQVMRYAEKQAAKRKPKGHMSRKRRHEGDSANDEGAGTSEQQSSSLSSAQQPQDDPQDLYRPVFCSSCNTCVAMFDHDEVYHFFNVLASHS